MMYVLIVLISTAVIFYLLDKLAKTSKYQIFGEYFTKVNTQKLVVALTYDDGPNPTYTNQLINLLNQLEAKATFFVIGQNIETHPETVKKLIDSGHEVGNHSYSHQKLIWKTPAFVRSEIEKTDELLRQLGVKQEILFRAPFGYKRFTLPYILKQMHKKNIMWNVDPKDYQETNPEIIAQRILDKVQPGAIILMHDGGSDSTNQTLCDRTATISATELIIHKLQAQGYKFLTVSEMLGNQVESAIL
jgi:peptidoglycan-N-acetylglucosamine deacetylase